MSVLLPRPATPGQIEVPAQAPHLGARRPFDGDVKTVFSSAFKMLALKIS